MLSNIKFKSPFIKQEPLIRSLGLRFRCDQIWVETEEGGGGGRQSAWAEFKTKLAIALEYTR